MMRARTWPRINDDPRGWAHRRRRLRRPAVDPKNPEIVYIASVVTWKSIDGGKTWTGIPRRARRRRLPEHLDQSRRIPKSSCSSAIRAPIVTVNGGETWSSWYNQPTAQIYHVIADNAFPYRVYGGQQESGSAGVASRGNDGEITFRDWHPVGVEEYGYVVPDPLDPDIVYGGKVTRYDRRTGQTANVGPMPVRSAKYRMLRTAPLVFSPVDPHILYLWSQYRLENARRRQDLARNQPGSDSQNLGRSRERR